MTDEHDPKVSAAYRALAAEEPPRALDVAILAAARRPADLTTRSWTRRWAVPVSLAAVVVLSVVVTLRAQHEQPGIERLEVAKAKAPAPAMRAKQAEVAAAKAERRAQSDDRPARSEIPQSRPAAQPEPAAVAADKTSVAKEADVAAAAPPPAAAVGELASRADQNRREVSSAAGAAAPQMMSPPPAPKSAALRDLSKDLPPDRELERIAELRKQAKHDEADKALAEFRKRFPDYKIPPAMLVRVERR